jgi:hypothetical protein
MTVIRVHFASVKEFQVVRTIGENRAESILCSSWEELRAVLELLGVCGLRLDYILEELEVSTEVEVRMQATRKSCQS